MVVRTILAILVVLAIKLLMADVFALIGFPLDARLERVLMILVALGALLYILRGAPLPPFWRRE
jgi:hypothetical protein